MKEQLIKIERALISVSDKTSIVNLSKELILYGVEIISTGGTASLLRDSNISVVEVSDITGFPEIMDGRVKTLHPKIHGGLLAVRDDQNHLNDMEKYQIPKIDLLITNLYPFEESIKRNLKPNEILNNIDVGGPTMIRAAAKNFQYSTVIVDKEDYSELIKEIRKNSGATSLKFRNKLAEIAFARCSAYDAAISDWMARKLNLETRRRFIIWGEIEKKLRYGENPHQASSLYAYPEDGFSIPKLQKHQGKDLSYNNINDLDQAYKLAINLSFLEKSVAVIVKHLNPCGVAVKEKLSDAYKEAYFSDKTSSFGGVVALNEKIDGETALEITKIFIEAVIAPGFTEDAKEIFSKKKNVRVLTANFQPEGNSISKSFKQVSGGFLIQEADINKITEKNLTVVTKRVPDQRELQDMLFAWHISKFVKSNAIVIAKNSQTIGIGAGQMSRIDSAKIAIRKACEIMGDEGIQESLLSEAVASSDAFFPFADSIFEFAKVGISAVIQPGGSINDLEVIEAADQAGIAMVFTNIRHFSH